MSSIAEEPLEARQALEFPYKHSTGEVIGRFLAGLKEQETIWGRRCPGQGVVVPPLGYSEATGAPDGEWVRVGNAGVVTAVAVVRTPIERLHPASAPFAVVLVKLEGADTALAHVVTERIDEVKVGSRVTAVWKPAADRVGSIRDLASFRLA